MAIESRRLENNHTQNKFQVPRSGRDTSNNLRKIATNELFRLSFFE